MSNIDPSTTASTTTQDDPVITASHGSIYLGNSHVFSVARSSHAPEHLYIMLQSVAEVVCPAYILQSRPAE